MSNYIIFPKDMTLNGIHYEIGKTYEYNGDLNAIFGLGYSFHKTAHRALSLCYLNEVVLCEIEVLGKIDYCKNQNRYVTDKMKIIKKFDWFEMFDQANDGLLNVNIGNVGSFNSGEKNLGSCNVGNSNVGSCNVGNYNHSDRNVGNKNGGSWNVGDENYGWYNTGKSNFGSHNTGEMNIGDYNTGDCNSGRRQSGVFCTEEEPKINFFDMPSNMTFNEWRRTDAYRLLEKRFKYFKFISKYEANKMDISDCTERDLDITGGYLKGYNHWLAWKMFWESLSKNEMSKFTSLPNFDPEKFKKITGIDIKNKSYVYDEDEDDWPELKYDIF